MKKVAQGTAANLAPQALYISCYWPKGVECSAAGKVTAGLAESNDGL